MAKSDAVIAKTNNNAIMFPLVLFTLLLYTIFLFIIILSFLKFEYKLLKEGK